MKYEDLTSKQKKAFDMLLFFRLHYLAFSALWG